MTASAWGRKRTPDRPYKILIIADENSTQSAEAYRTYIMGQRPYNRMRPEDLVVEIQSVTAAEMACSNPGTTNARLVSCDTRYLRGLRRDANASIAVAFTSTATGGSGGEIPIATSNFEAYPIGTMFHEMLHAYGFADEYQYQTEGERTSFCNPPRRLPNIAYFNDNPPYESDASARSIHGNDVPWMGDILPEVLITHGTDLGTTTLPATVRGNQAAGLFAGGPCSLWMKSWRPYQGSIMREYQDDTIYPLYERVILERIADAIGRTPVLRENNQDIVITGNTPAPDCPPDGTEGIAKIQDFGKDGLRVLEGMENETIRDELKRLQDFFNSPESINLSLPPEAEPPVLVIPLEEAD